MEQAEQHPDYSHQTYADYAASFRKAKASGKMAEQPAPEYLQGAAIALDNATGDILVLVGGRDFEHNQFNRALQARRPAGTAMLPFVYATAFERGMYPGSVVEDSPLDNRAVMIGGTTGILGEWGPEDATTSTRSNDRQAGAREIEEWRNGPHRDGGGNRGGDQLCPRRVFVLRFALIRRHFSAAAKLRWRARDGIHDFSERRLATEHAAYSGSHRGKRRNTGVEWEAAKHPEDRDQTRDRLRSAFVPGRCASIGHRRAAYTKFGLKKFPAAGKTGTAYDFTDALFAGYDSSFTCAVWAGFDKPQKIYRGAFGREIALPIWVDIMNAAAQSYPPKEIKQPSRAEADRDLFAVWATGDGQMLRRSEVANGDTVQRRTTYMEIATQAQAPTELCNVHGEPRARLAREFGSSDLPHAELAVNLSEVMPVAIKSPTLTAENDPYDSIKPTVIPDTTPQPATETAETQKSDSGAGTNGVKSASNTASVNPPDSQRRNPLRRFERRSLSNRFAKPSRSNRRTGNRRRFGVRYR